VKYVSAEVFLGEEVTFEKLVPVFDDVSITPGGSFVLVDMKYHMIMVAHNGIGGDVDGEDGA